MQPLKEKTVRFGIDGIETIEKKRYNETKPKLQKYLFNMTDKEKIALFNYWVQENLYVK